MLEFITKFFRREEASKTMAKERLRLVLMSDRVSLAPDVFDEMKSEMLAVIRRYLEIDEHALDLHFENLERQFALLASIPVLKVKTAEHVSRWRSGDAPAGANGSAGANGAAVTTEAKPSKSQPAANGTATRAPAPRRRRRRRRSPNTPPDGTAPPQADSTDPPQI